MLNLERGGVLDEHTHHTGETSLTGTNFGIREITIVHNGTKLVESKVVINTGVELRMIDPSTVTSDPDVLSQLAKGQDGAIKQLTVVVDDETRRTIRAELPKEGEVFPGLK